MSRQEGIKYIRGFSIPDRELTEEEKTREVTLERFEHWLEEAGEDFIDYHEFGDGRIFAGWMLHKYSHDSVIIRGILNDCYSYEGRKIISIQELMQYYEDNGDGWKNFYRDYAEFINMFPKEKEGVNRQLIILTEHYRR